MNFHSKKCSFLRRVCEIDINFSTMTRQTVGETIRLACTECFTITQAYYERTQQRLLKNTFLKLTEKKR